MARPLAKIDPKQVENLAAIGCTTPEIAAVLECSEDTLERRFAGPLKKGRLKLKTSLRRMQYQAAAAGSIPMLIWLGKNLLGQADQPKPDTEDDFDIDLSASN